MHTWKFTTSRSMNESFGSISVEYYETEVIKKFPKVSICCSSAESDLAKGRSKVEYSFRNLEINYFMKAAGHSNIPPALFCPACSNLTKITKYKVAPNCTFSQWYEEWSVYSILHF